MYYKIIFVSTLLVFYQNCAPSFTSTGNYENSTINSELSGGGSQGETNPGTGVSAGVNFSLSYVGLRPLAKVELENSLSEIFAPTVLADSQWELNIKKPFDNYVEDNEYGKKQVERSFLTAEALTNKILNTSNPLIARVPCLKDNKNLNCLKSYVSYVLPIFFRGLESPEDVDEYNQFAQQKLSETNNFELTLKLVTQAFLLDAKFLYRLEEGRAVAGGHSALSDLEYLNKLSFFLTGKGPSFEIVKKVKGGYFSNKANIEAYIDSIIASPLYVKNMARFHLDWLGFGDLKVSDDFGKDSYNESYKLIEKIIHTQDTSWFKIFTSKETYINNRLAENYGLPKLPNDKWRWVNMGNNGRAGILGHASFLSLGVDGQETNPTKRGYHMQKTLFCGVIGAPPADVDVDEKPPEIKNGRNCKIDRVSANTLTAKGCAECHKFMEAVGFGLENYDFRGRYIAHEKDNPECDIATAGQANTYDVTRGGFVNLGSFNSPESLGKVLTESGQISKCMIQRLIEFDIGNKIRNREPLISKLNTNFLKSESFNSLIKYYVTLPEYRSRK